LAQEILNAARIAMWAAFVFNYLKSIWGQGKKITQSLEADFWLGAVLTVSADWVRLNFSLSPKTGLLNPLMKSRTLWNYFNKFFLKIVRPLVIGPFAPIL
jgi:hypothetical protein